MKDDSANTLLKTIMNWSNDGITREIPNLQALAAYGYDDYQQFKPGMRFIESLAGWLNRIPHDKRNTAFDFIKDRLLFITRSQMEQIVSTAYPDYIIPLLLNQVSKESKKKIPRWNVAKIIKSKEFEILHHQCLFTGLSDGSQIDIFRRSNSKINHEQVSRTHEINKPRAEKIEKELKKRLDIFKTEKPSKYFRNVFLLDDFSASGISYLKEKESAPCGVTGKIASFYNSIQDKNDPLYDLINLKDLRVYLILYVATEDAKIHLQKLGKKLFSSIHFSVIVIHTIRDHVKYDENENKEFTKLIKDKKYGWEEISDIHTAQGDESKPYLGFDSCALPIILHHNTPNNSLPILHRNDDKTEFKGLFPRISRHQ